MSEDQVVGESLNHEGGSNGDRQLAGSDDANQQNMVSVSQLQQLEERDPRLGGAPIYEQEARAR